jgi:hypothetical protein
MDKIEAGGCAPPILAESAAPSLSAQVVERVAQLTANRDAAPSGVSDAMVERAGHAYAAAAISEGYEGPGDLEDTHRRWMRAALEAAQPQPGRVEGMDGARWRKLCALVDTHNPAYWYVHPGMGCDRIKGEAQLVAAIDAAPTASSQEADHGDDEESCSFCLQRGCNGECGGDQ